MLMSSLLFSTEQKSPSLPASHGLQPLTCTSRCDSEQDLSEEVNIADIIMCFMKVVVPEHQVNPLFLFLRTLMILAQEFSPPAAPQRIKASMWIGLCQLIRRLLATLKVRFISIVHF